MIIFDDLPILVGELTPESGLLFRKLLQGWSLKIVFRLLVVKIFGHS